MGNNLMEEQDTRSDGWLARRAGGPLTLFLIAGSAPFCMKIFVNFRRPIAAAI